ncbi:hypothetical protein L218DRAFT_551897 [Marasmius fiardii PR-910]|nr:hypothetical protein L218DRAFT_551897 [Marasmius fiardii PR-910]
MITLLPLVFALFRPGVAQFGTVFTIEVGRSGSFFIPDSVNARVGDTVQFKFFDAVHGVVQTSFETPCQPLPGGFSSGAVPALNGSVFEWDLQITNTSTIWFYCPILIPVLHCTTGMVGAINPLGEPQVDDFKASAKAFSGPPMSVSVALSGVGAAATASPSVINAGTGGAIPTTNSTSEVTSPPTAPKIPSTSSSTSIPEESANRTPAIVGGTVAGLVALFATIIAVVIVLRRRPRRSSQQGHNTVESHLLPTAASPLPPSSGIAESFTGKVGQPQGNQTQFYPLRAEDVLPSIGYAGGYRNDTDPSSGSSNARAQAPLHVRNQSSQGNLLGVIRSVLSSERLHQHPYSAPGVNVDETDLFEPEPRSEDINALAKEVAAVLLRGQNKSQDLGNAVKQGSQRRDGGGAGNVGKGSDSPRRNFVEGPPPDYKSRGHSTHGR